MDQKNLFLLAALLAFAGLSSAQSSGLDFRTQDPIDFYSNISMNDRDIGGISGLAGINYQRFDNEAPDFIYVREAPGESTSTHTFRYDDSPLHFYSGSGGSTMELTQGGDLDLLGNDLVNPDMIETDGTGSDVVIVRDTSQTQDLARFYEGGNVTLPSGTLSLDLNRLTELGAPATGTDAVRLQYLAANYVNRSGDTLAGPLNLDTHDINNIGSLGNYYGSPCASGNAMVDVSDNGDLGCVDVTNTVSDDFVTRTGDSMTGDLDMTGNDILDTGLVDGVNIESPGNAITVDSSNGYAVPSGAIDTDELASGSVTNTQLANTDSFTVGGLTSNGNIDVSENLIQNVNALQDNTGTDTVRFDGSNNVVLPSGNLNMDGNSITNFFGNPCASGNMMVDVGDDGTLSCTDVTDEVNEDFVSRSGDSMSGNLDMSGNDINNVKNLDMNSQGVIEVDGTDAIRLDSGQDVAIPNGNLDMQSNDILGVNNLKSDGLGALKDSNGNNRFIWDFEGSLSNDVYRFDDRNGNRIISLVDGGNVEIPNGDLQMSSNNIEWDSGNLNIQNGGFDATASGGDGFEFYNSNSNLILDIQDNGNHILGGNLNMDGNSITNFFSNPCASGNAVVDVGDDGTISCTDVTNMVSDDFVTRTGDSMTGNLDMTGNKIQDIDRATFDSGQAMITTHDGYGNFNIKAGVDNGNNIVAGSGGSHIQMSDNGDISLLADTGTSEGGSFSTSAELEVANNVEVKSANLDMSGNSITNYFGSACPTGETLVDIQDSGNFACMNVTEEVSEAYVSRSGDSMNGDLVMNNNDVEQVSDINSGGTTLNVGGDVQVSGTVTATGGLETESGSVTSNSVMCLGDQCN